jgi:hypothetical protein
MGAPLDLTIEPFGRINNRYEMRGADVRLRCSSSWRCDHRDGGTGSTVVSWPPMRLARLRRERESVVVVSPAAPVCISQEVRMRRVIGIDIHRTFGEVVFWDRRQAATCGPH